MNKSKLDDEKIFYIFLLGGCFLLYLIWAMVIPFNHGPDEHMRYQIPEFIYKYGYLPHGGDERIREATWGISYGFTPIFSYIISALFMKITSVFTTSEGALLLAARMVSVICSTGTVYFCIKISNKLFKGIFRLVFVISVALLPQFIFISAYVNNDAFGIFTVAWIIYAVITAEEKNWDFRSCAFLGIGMGLCAISYYNCYGIMVAAFLYAIVSVLSNKQIENKFKFIIVRILWVLLFVVLVAGWWFIRNAIIYDGDFLGLNTSSKYAEMYAVEAYKPSNRQTAYQIGMSFKEMMIDNEWLKISTYSFVGHFDAMSLPLEQWCYSMIFTLMVIGLVGCIIPGRIIKNNSSKCDFKLWMSMLLMCIITICISIWYSYFNDWQPQGRYCLPMVVSFCILLTDGWSKLFNRSNKIIRNAVAIIIILGYCIVSTFSSYYVIIPRYVS